MPSGEKAYPPNPTAIHNMLEKELALVVVLLVYSETSPQLGPLIKIEDGAFRGKYLTSAGGRKFAAFEGIPYAQPPTGKYRFKEPMPPRPWAGVWSAISPGTPCLQYHYLDAMKTENQLTALQGSEDCLYLNVYSPRLPEDGDEPQMNVMVNIHGGGFTFGQGHMSGPKYLMDRDVVLVTFNYRVGPLGFLSTEDEVVRGNMGLKDQVQALRWVQKNIASFGGNPGSVTLHGNSAGAASVHYQFLSPMSRGLFHRGISQSGNALCPWAQMKADRKKANKLAQSLGCSTETSEELVQCLRQRPASKIVAQVPTFQAWRFVPFGPFGPTVEMIGNDTFLDREPVDAILEGQVHNLPYIISVTTEEGLFPVADWLSKEELLIELEDRYAELAPHIFDYNYTTLRVQKEPIALSILYHYFEGKSISRDTLPNLIRMVGDRLFVMETDRVAKLQAAVNTAPVYFYQFGYRGKNGLSKALSRTNINFGVCHADDIAYLLEVEFNNIEETPEDREMSKAFLDLVEAFMSNGNPVPHGSKLQWDPVTRRSTELVYLFIANSSHMEMRSSSDLGNRRFWGTLPLFEPQYEVDLHNMDQLIAQLRLYG